MRKCLWIAPVVLLLAGCSRTNPGTSTSQAPNPANSTAAAASVPVAQAGSRGSAPPMDAYGQPRVVNRGSADRLAEGGSPPLREPVMAEDRAFAAREASASAGYAIPRGTRLQVRINQGVDTRNNRAGDGFSAVLMRPVVVDGGTVLPAGTPFTGHVTVAANSGRFKGRAVIGVTLDSFRLRGREHRIDTSSVQRVSSSHKKRNLFLIGGGSGVGAAIGAIAGGGKGAAIGALAGGGAGTAGAAATGKKHVGIASETGLTFRLTSAVRM